MMSAGKAWIISVIESALLVMFFYLWQFDGMEGAGNVLTFYLWSGSALGILAGVTCDKSSFDNDPHRPTYKVVRMLVIVGALVWVGMVWLPAVFVVAYLCMSAARNRDPKAKKEGSPA